MGPRTRRSQCPVLAYFLAAVAALPGAETRAQVLEQLVVNVNGDILTHTQIQELQAAAASEQLGRPVSVAQLRDDPSVRKVADEMAPKIVAEAIDEVLIVQQAHEFGLTATDEDVDNVLARVKADHELDSDEKLWSLLRMAAISPVRRRESLRRRILMEQVRQRVIRGIEADDDEARAFFSAHREAFVTPATVTYREIFVAIPPEPPLGAGSASHQARDRALIRFVAARDRVLRGESFADVAAQLSESEDGPAGALIGPLPVAEVASAVRDALARLKPGDVSMPIKGDDGYRLVKLDELTPASSPPFEAIREAVISRASAEMQLAAVRRYMARLRSTAVLKWKNPTLQAAYERYVAEP